VTIPFQNSDPKAIEIVQVILESVCKSDQFRQSYLCVFPLCSKSLCTVLRREKKMKDRDGNPIIPLPAKHLRNDYLDLSPQEAMIYQKIYSNAQAKFQAFTKLGTVLNNVTTVLALLMRLRQAVLHPMLVLKKMPRNAKDVEDAPPEEISIRQMIADYASGGDKGYAAQVLQQLVKGDDGGQETECCICLDVRNSRACRFFRYWSDALKPLAFRLSSTLCSCPACTPVVRIACSVGSSHSRLEAKRFVPVHRAKNPPLG
jgi:DNA repair protein RAD5